MSAIAAVPDRPDTSALTQEASMLVQSAHQLVITDDASYAAACEFGKGVKALQKRIADFFAPHKKRAKAVHDALCEDERKQLAPTQTAEGIAKSKVLEWQASERERQGRERIARETEARRLEEERQLQRALDAEAEGDWPETVDEILSEPIETPVVAAPRPVAKVAGVANTNRWTFDATRADIAAVIRHIAGLDPNAPLAHPDLVRLLTLDKVATRQIVTAKRETFSVPSIRAYQAEGVAFGSK